ncbi:MAG TPA: M23 family metallopeptidase [Candidatus Binatia bacterium]|nr:M23 family metallopeptidase [Candidatus Binatia bacterium]
MRRLLALLGLLLLAGLLLTRAEPFAPTAELVHPPDVVGRATPITVVARDRGTGLGRVEIRLVPAAGGVPVVVAARDFPRVSFFGSGVHEATVAATVDAAAAHVPEGPATLEVWATDHSWLAGLHRGPRLAHAVAVDLTPPTLDVLTNRHVVRQGGSECVVYRVGADAVRSGVEEAGDLYPGTAGVFADPTLRAALFAVPPDADPAPPIVVATDAAGNRREQHFDVTVRTRRFAERTLALSDAFLAGKIPPLLREAGLADDGDLVAGFRRVNGELRRATEARIRALCAHPTPEPLWQGAFLRLPDSAPLAGFADHRTYEYQGRAVDRSLHLGFDLASVKAAPVPAGNAGRVVFAGPLGIYGNAVLLDHGLGLFSLYGHMSAIAVQPGDAVARGQVLGRTGDTGLAGGDHLHFGLLVDGTWVDPVEWWDAHWIEDHVLSRLAAFPRAAVPGASS